MNHGDVVRDAALISWRNKFLWFFGFWLTSLSAGGFSRNFSAGSSNPPAWTQAAARWFTGNETLALTLLGIAVSLVLLLYLFFGIVSSGGMARSVAAIDRGESRGFSSTFRSGLSSFWGVLGQAVLLLLIGVGVTVLFVIVFGLPIFLTFFFTPSLAARILVSAVFGLVGLLCYLAGVIFYYVVCQYALRELAIGGKGVAGSIAAGWRLFAGHFGRSLLVWLVFFALWFGVWILLSIISLVLGLLFALPALLAGSSGPTTATGAIEVIIGLILLPLGLLLSGALGSFFRSYWTLSYLRLTAQPESSPEPV